jgi:hypothetical protein
MTLCPSLSLATTPSSKGPYFSDWDPDTPTLKAWAKRELASCRQQLEGQSSEEDDGEDEDDDNVDTIDTVGGRASKSICTTSLSSKEDERSRSDVDGAGDGEDEEGEDGPRLNLTRLAFRSTRDGLLYPSYSGMSDSSEGDGEGDEEDREREKGFAYGDSEEDSDLDDEDGDTNEEMIDRYYRVDDDDETAGDGDDEDEDGELYDDTS